VAAAFGLAVPVEALNKPATTLCSGSLDDLRDILACWVLGVNGPSSSTKAVGGVKAQEDLEFAIRSTNGALRQSQ